MKFHLLLLNSALATIVALPLHAQITVTTDTTAVSSSVAPTFDDFDGTYNTAVATVTGGLLDPGGSTSPTGTTGNYLAASLDPATDITITFAGPASYFGLLWGSPDPNNTITFLNGTTVVGSTTAAGIGPVLLPVYPALGTYVNFSASAPSDDFTSVVLSDNSPGIPYFEVDNLAAVVPGTSAPEIDPAFVGSGLALLVGGLLVLRGRQKLSGAAI